MTAEPLAAAVPRVTDWSVDPETVEAYDKAIALFGHISDLFAALGHAPTVLSGWIDLTRRLRHDLAVDPRLHELLVVRVSQCTGAAYPETAHRRLALACGVRPEQLEAIAEWPVSEEFSTTERAVLQFAEQVAAAQAGPEQTTALMELLGERQTTELLVVASFYCCVGRVTKALDVQPRSAG
jgi:AhpD family alkylhydroperoxidase